MNEHDDPAMDELRAATIRDALGYVARFRPIADQERDRDQAFRALEELLGEMRHLSEDRWSRLVALATTLGDRDAEIERLRTELAASVADLARVREKLATEKQHTEVLTRARRNLVAKLQRAGGNPEQDDA